MSLLNTLLMFSIVLLLLWFWKWILKVAKGIDTGNEEWTKKMVQSWKERILRLLL